MESKKDYKKYPKNAKLNTEESIFLFHKYFKCTAMAVPILFYLGVKLFNTPFCKCKTIVQLILKLT